MDGSNNIFMISVVIPIYNEEEVVPELLSRLEKSSGSWKEYEIIFVDDGSRDNSFSLLSEVAEKNSNIKVIKFSRNFGHQIAISAGLMHASGDAVAIIDGDLQDPPEMIDKFIEKWKEGYDVVYAIRASRKENIFKRVAYSTFYKLLKRLSSIDIPLDAGDFSLIDRKVVDVINGMPEQNRFVRGLRSWAGFRSVGVSYERSARFAGKPKFTLRKLFNLAFDGIISFSTTPLKISVYVGFIIALLSFLAGVYYIILKLTHGIDLQGWTSIMLAIFFIGGVQLFIIGILGEYIGRIYTQVQDRPLYVIEKKSGFR